MLEPDILARVFSRLGKEKELLEFRDILFQMLGVVMDFVNADGQTLRLSQGRNFSPLCRCIRSNPACAERCHQCDISYSQKAAASKLPLIYTCHAGLIEIVVPIFGQRDEYLGCLTSGQFRKSSIESCSNDYLSDLAQLVNKTPEELAEMYAKCTVLSDEQIKGLVAYLQIVGRLLTTVHHNLVFMESKDAPERITSAKQYIHEHFAENLSLTQIARHFSIAPGYFCRLFKQECGVGFNSYLNYYRIEKAKEFLADSQLYIANIATLTGFGSIIQFNRIFKRLTGTTPVAWRKEHHSINA